MTLANVTYKNMKHSKTMYGAFLFSSALTVYMFTLMIVLLFNKEFMFAALSKTIFTVFLVVILVVAVFAMIFIPFCYRSLMIVRAKDFGLLMVLGMERRQLGKMILVESIIFGCGSVGMGILFGGLSSYFFYLALGRFFMVDLSSISFILSPWSIAITVIFFGLVFLFATLIALHTFKQKHVLYFLKMAKKKTDVQEGKAWIGFIGVVILVGALLMAGYVTLSNVRGNGFSVPVLLLSVVLCLIGFYLALGNFGNLFVNMVKGNKGYYYKHLLKLSQLSFRFFNYKLVVFLVSLISAVTVFLLAYVGMGVSFSPYTVEQTSPFDMEVTIKEGDPVGEELESMVLDNRERLQQYKLVRQIRINDLERIRGQEVIDIGRLYIMEESEAEKLINRDFNLADGEAVYIYNYLPRAEKTRRISKGDIISKDNIRLSVIESDDIPFAMTLSGCMVLNEKTYNSVTTKAEYFINHHVFDLEQSYDQVFFKEILDYISKATGTEFDASDRFSYYQYVFSKTFYKRLLKVETRGYCFAFIYPAILFVIATGCVLYFVIMMDTPVYEKQYKQFKLVGMSDEEYKKYLGGVLRPLFMLPCVLGGLVGAFYLVTMVYVELSAIPFVLISSVLVIAFYLLLNYGFYLYCRSALLKNFKDWRI